MDETTQQFDSEGRPIPSWVKPEVWEKNKEKYELYHQDLEQSMYYKVLNDSMIDFTDQVNMDIVNKTYDRPLVEYVVNSLEAFEIIPAITFVGYEYTTDEYKIAMHRYIKYRGKGWKKTVIENGRKKSKMVHNYKEIEPNRCGLLTMHYEVKLEVPKMTEDKRIIPGEFITKTNKVKNNILVPIEDEDGYYLLNGKRKYLIYQLTEKSTYTTKNAVTTKSLLPVYIKRKAETITDMDGIEYRVPIYIMKVFDKEHPTVLFFLANGVDRGIAHLMCNDIIFFKETYTEEDKELHLIFKISGKLFILVHRGLFKKYMYVRSVVGGILAITNSHMNMESFYDTTNYIKQIGGKNLAKGENTLLNFHRLLDKNTKLTLKIDDMFTMTVYDLILYMMQNFNELRNKDNLSLDNKRLCRRELVTRLISKDVSRRISDVIRKGKNADMDAYLNALKIPANILIQKMNSSKLLRTDDIVNDNQALMKLRYTIKGPNSVGGKNQNKISKEIRGIHPSYLGELDMLHCGNSDPGTTGIINPFTKMKSFYFDDSDEPDDFLFEYMADVEHVLEEDYGAAVIVPEYHSREEFYHRQQAIRLHESGLFDVEEIPIGGLLEEEVEISNLNGEEE